MKYFPEQKSARSMHGSRELILCLFLAASSSAALAAPSPPPAQTAQTAQPTQSLTVERIYSAPNLGGYPLRDTSWSPDGKLFTYLDTADSVTGTPEIGAIDAATGRKRVLVDAAHLRDILLPAASRGQQTGLGRITAPRYLWSPDSKALLFISAEELFWYDLASGKSKSLLLAPAKAGADESASNESSATQSISIDDAKISPDGGWVSFVRAHDLWVVSVAAGPPRQITHGGSEALRHGELDWVYPEELDLYTAYWWSPDSSRIAYLELDERGVMQYPIVDLLSPEGALMQERYPIAGSANPVARIGVVAISGGDSQWLDTGSDKTALLARAVWLPDSRGVAVERLNRVQNRLDLLFADVVNGKSRAVLTEQDKYWINLADDFQFLADGKRFLWSSERSGFRHLYLYDLGGKQLAQLTSGSWQVDGVAGVSDKNNCVYFASSQKSPIERHFYSVPLSGGASRQLTHSPGTHEVDLAPDFAHFVDKYSAAATPPRQDLYNADGSSVAVVDENKVSELDRYHLQPVEFFTVPASDGTPLEAELIRPPSFDPARHYPAIVYLYGGPHASVVRDAWEGADFLWNEMMAQRGFVVFAVDGRGTAGRGHNFETPIFHHFGEVELSDVLAGVSWLKQQRYVDAARIGIWGWSFGGYMTVEAMLRGGGVFKAGFAGAPVTDWRMYDTIYTERYMGTPQENPDGYRESSPANFAAGLEGKLLIAHATGDDNVHFANTVELAEKLVQAQKYAEVQIYAGRGHGIGDAAGRIHVFNRATQFFLENLAP